MCRRVLLPGIGWAWLLTLTIAGLCGADVRRHHFEAAGIAFGVGSFVFVVLERRVTKSLSASEHPAEPRAAYLVPGAAAVIAYGWSIGVGPLSDDFVLHRWASSGTLLPTEWSHLRPFPLAIWSGVFALGGRWEALHALNVSVHTLNSVLVAALAGRWVGPRAGVAAGVVFALMPTSVEAVVWTAGVFDLMAALFVLLAANACSRYPASPGRIVAIILFSLAGVLSKESAIVLPVLLALIAAPPRSDPLRVAGVLPACGRLESWRADSWRWNSSGPLRSGPICRTSRPIDAS